MNTRLSNFRSLERWLGGIGWVLVAVGIATMLVFGGRQMLAVFAATQAVPAHDAFQIRYLEHPWITAAHVVTGVAFIVFAPLQFIAALRRRHVALHRWSGRILIALGAVAGLYGLVTTAVFPVFGGVSSATAAYLFGPLFLFALAAGFVRIRQRNVPAHRAWMIRMFALGLGVATQRIVIGLLLATSDMSFVEVFGPALWTGFTVNLLAAEIWIRFARPLAR